uniref:Uncharacterized protein n=1 Tax=Vespula pensylvanica TaxID=30213 RepID=A0A834MZP8_VESPE|nr:hypothetical protein H0235_018128 [Vespula pensylvanica]
MLTHLFGLTFESYWYVTNVLFNAAVGKCIGKDGSSGEVYFACRTALHNPTQLFLENALRVDERERQKEKWGE